MAYTAETIQTHTKIASAWANKIEQELATVGNYLGRVATKGLLNGLSADYKDFAWVDNEQAFYWYAGNGWFPYDVKRLKEGFTLVNLLGSHGSFDKDSNGDGLADGVDIVTAYYGSPNLFKLSNGVQGATRSDSQNAAMGIDFQVKYNHKYFCNDLFKADSSLNTNLAIFGSPGSYPFRQIINTISLTTSFQPFYVSFVPDLFAINTNSSYVTNFCS